MRKRNKLMAVICLGVLCLGLLSGCAADEPLPAGMDEAAVLAAGQEVFDLLQAEQYDEVAALLREDIRTEKGITGAIVKEQLAIDKNTFGTFKKVEETWTSGVSGGEVETHGIAWFECKYSEEKVVFGFAFDLELQLIGLSVSRE